VSLVSATPQTPRLLRDRSGVQRVTNIELFFDLAATDRLPGVHPPD
jgi:low temperature requirement protein LtrA